MKNGKKGIGIQKVRKNAVDGRTIVSVLDIGSSKICCFIAEVKAHGGIEVIGIGHQASRGVRNGTIVDLKAAEGAVAHAVEAAENMAAAHLQGQPIKSVFVNVSGVHSLSQQMMVDVGVTAQQVSDRDIRAALMHAFSAAIPGKTDLIHAIPVSYSIDQTRGIQEPRGMIGDALGVNLTAITANAAALHHLSAVVGQNHLELDGFCNAAYAAGLSALTPDEMQLGCTVVDMGGGTTSIAVFAGGKLVYTAAIPVGGNHVTNDIARGLTTSTVDAERIKTLYGYAMAGGIDEGAMIDVPPLGEEEHSQPNYVPRSYLTGIIQPRVEETMELVRAKLVDSGINKVAGRRVVLTGGASQLPGLCDIAKLVLDKQVRLGRPQNIKGLAEATGGPAFSTAAGLLLYAAEHGNEIPVTQRPQSFQLPVLFNGQFMQKVTGWLKENW